MRTGNSGGNPAGDFSGPHVEDRPPNPGHQLGAGTEPRTRIRVHTAPDHPIQPAWQRGQRGQRRNPAGQMSGDDRRHIPDVRRVPGETAEKHTGQRIHVR